MLACGILSRALPCPHGIERFPTLLAAFQHIHMLPGAATCANLTPTHSPAQDDRAVYTQQQHAKLIAVLSMCSYGTLVL
jgi:hypothetical protein